MGVMPLGPCFYLQVQEDHTFRVLKSANTVDLNLRFKHMSLAFLVFSFQESTTRAFANDRILVDGEISYAVRFVRCLNRMETIILPKFIANLAVKDYPTQLTLREKVTTAAQVYRRVFSSYLARS